MPRSIWNGAISFGLVNVPVQLFSAVESKDVHFHEFQAGTGARIKHKRVSERTGREVDYGDIEKGYETSRGKYVMLTQEELDSVDPGRSRTIDIEDFVELAEIDPLYFDKPYYLAPQKGAEKSYALLRDAMAKSETASRSRASSCAPSSTSPRSARPTRCSCWRRCTSPTRSAIPPTSTSPPARRWRIVSSASRTS